MDSATLFFGVFYFAASSTMLLVNKLAVTHLPAPTLVTSMQYLVAAGIVFVLANWIKLLDADTVLKPEVIKKYIFVPFLFSLAIFSNMKLLETANVETFMVFRFSTPIFVALVDFALMGKALPSWRTWLSFALIVSGAVAYALTDEGFSLDTYSWAVVYLVTITTEMIVVKHIFSTVKMTNWTRVYLNNLLSLLFQPFFAFLTGEQKKFVNLKWTPVAIVFLVISCVLGTALAWSGTALRARISATSFTVVGVACKIVTELANFLMWDKHANTSGILALLACFIGSILFQAAPSRNQSTWISNSFWNALNRITCGRLGRWELESPEFAHELEKNPAAAGPAVDKDQKYMAVSTNPDLGLDDEEAEIEIDEDIERDIEMAIKGKPHEEKSSK